MVGIEIPTIGANGTPFRGAADVVFRPAGFTGTITNDWATVPRCTTDFGNYSDPAVDHLTTVHNPTRGIGDICRHMGVIDSANWRMPTAKEWAELYGSKTTNGGEATIPPGNGGWILGSFHPLSGYALGPNRNIVRILSDIEVSNADPYDDGAVFLPASGHRTYTNGAIWSIGSWGNYWSSTASAEDRGYEIQFSSSNVLPQQLNSRIFGFSVRCIRE